MIDQRKYRTEWMKRWRAANPEEARAVARRHYWKHRERILAEKRVSDKANRAAVTESQRKSRAKRPDHYGKVSGKGWAAWAERNPEAAAARFAKYREKNPEAQAIAAKKYRDHHPERTAAAQARWNKENKDKVAAFASNRRAAKLQRTPAWADHELIELVYAEAAHRGLHVDHIVPLRSKKVCGLHVHYNMQLLTQSENSMKGTKFPYAPTTALKLGLPIR